METIQQNTLIEDLAAATAGVLKKAFSRRSGAIAACFSELGKPMGARTVRKMKVEFNKGDAVEFAKNYQGEPFHSILLDPPYHLTDVNTTGANNNFGKRSDEQKEMRRQARQKGFMNNEWDGGDVAFRAETWAAFRRIMFDGAFGVAFCGSRGWHRQAVAIEDAGFIIHPTIFLWAFGSGFPKSQRIDTQIDNAAGAEREIIGVHPQPNSTGWITANKAKTGNQDLIARPATDDAIAWSGHRYGLQAMKPAVEPIILFQKPYAKGKPPFQQINDSGAGALNIDGTRIGSETVKTRAKEKGESFSSVGNGATSGGGGFNGCDETERNGRWASNLILCHLPACRENFCADSCPVLLIGEQSGFDKGGNAQTRSGFNTSTSFRASKGAPDALSTYGDAGTAARFFFQSDYLAERLEETDPVFYCPKASDDERNAGLSRYTGQPRLTMNDGIGGQPVKTTVIKPNHHPTVKPLKLSAYLAKLLLPPEKYAPHRRIFNPFSGSGSESIGALRAGWDEIVCVEQSADYIEIAKARFAYWATVERTKQMILFPEMF